MKHMRKHEFKYHKLKIPKNYDFHKAKIKENFDVRKFFLKTRSRIQFLKYSWDDSSFSACRLPDWNDRNNLSRKGFGSYKYWRYLDRDDLYPYYNFQKSLHKLIWAVVSFCMVIMAIIEKIRTDSKIGDFFQFDGN